ncbi:MAG: hypothetical protein FGM43_01320 [Sinobacteraceae bacterium]|nr:hypothetical protein [Nevskiaceae bacterium]
MSRLLILAPLAIVCLLSGCASVPLASMLKLASLGTDGLAAIEPLQLRVRLSVSPGYEIDVGNARLRLSLPEGEGRSRETELSLDLMERSIINRSAGLFRGSVATPTYLLRLTPGSANELAALKARLATKSGGKRGFSVNAPFSKIPSNAETVSFWADLRLATDADWIALIDGAKLKIRKKE